MGSPHIKYKTFWRRFIASLIDGLLLMPIGWLDNLFISSESTRLVVEWGIVTQSAPWIYSVLMHGYYGQTIGKMATGIKVLDVSESPISLRQAFLRDCVTVGLTTIVLILFLAEKLFGSFVEPTFIALLTNLIGTAGLVWFLVETVTMLTNEKRRALHDFIAGTVVVRPQYIEERKVISQESPDQSKRLEVEVNGRSELNR
jgi:uncharacterized RDD family membrane protein YckC